VTVAKSRFQTFVAIRYLVADPMPHISALALAFVGFFLVNAAWMTALIMFGLEPPQPHALLPTGSAGYETWVAVRNGCIGVAVFVLYVFLVRMFFTFYSTVSIVGLSIGGAALVVVLSVMNGFESDLRAKILGSNAHVQVSKEDGEFTEWEDVRARIERTRGVVASTPFATSEVVVAANSNYFNVVVKGIDVPSAVQVTDLAQVIRTQDDRPDPEALDRLEPLVDEGVQAPVVAPPSQPPAGPVIDPAPSDLPGGGAPIDYSAPDDSAGAGGGRDDAAIATDPRGAPELAPPLLDLGGEPPLGPDDGPPEGPTEGPIDDPALLDRLDEPMPPPPLADPAPADFAGGEPVDTAQPPADYSEPAAPVVRDPIGGKRRPSRVATLDGLLAGKELFKQIHLYVDQEVRLVSPLADPMNPDANGTPIPFNRDYRVAGMFYTGMYEYDLKLIYVSLESLQEFLRMGDAIDGIEVRIRDPEAVDSVVAALQKELGPTYRVQGWRELNRNLFSALKLEKIAMFLVLAIIILVASFSIVGTLIVTVVEKGKEIALLKTLGASDGGIVGVFVIQGLSIGLIGISLGVSIGLIGTFLLSRFGFPLNPDVYYIDRLPIEVDPLTVSLVFAAGIVISVAATIYPAVLAAQLRPAHGLKM